MHDLARDERISKFKTGRRFVYIVLPVVPLHKSVVYLHQNSTTKSNQKVWPVRPALNARKQVILPGIAQMNRFAVHVLVLCTKLGIPSAAWELICQHQHQLIPAWAAWLMQPPPSPTSSLHRHQLGVTCLDGPACHPTPCPRLAQLRQPQSLVVYLQPWRPPRWLPRRLPPAQVLLVTAKKIRPFLPWQCECPGYPTREAQDRNWVWQQPRWAWCPRIKIRPRIVMGFQPIFTPLMTRLCPWTVLIRSTSLTWLLRLYLSMFGGWLMPKKKVII